MRRETIEKIKKVYAADNLFPNIKLEKFLSLESYELFSRQSTKAKFKKKYLPDRESFSEAEIPEQLRKFILSPEFKGFISEVLGKKISIKSCSLRSFGWKDYSLLHDNELVEKGTDIILEFTNRWEEIWGGSTTYRSNGGEFRTLSVSDNTLFIIERKKGIRDFVKYVNHHAGKNRRVFVAAHLR